jgi:hypothetical protein
MIEPVEDDISKKLKNFGLCFIAFGFGGLLLLLAPLIYGVFRSVCS